MLRAPESLPLPTPIRAPRAPARLRLEPSRPRVAPPARGEALTEAAWVEPLLEGWDKLGVDVPRIIYERSVEADPQDASRAELRRDALLALAASPVRIEPLTFAGAHGLAVRAPAEKILDGALLSELGARLEARTLAVAVPERDRILVASADPGASSLGAFGDEVARRFRASLPTAALSPTVFLAEAGKIIGVSQPPSSSGASRVRGLLGRIFH